MNKKEKNIYDYICKKQEEIKALESEENLLKILNKSTEKQKELIEKHF